MTYITTAEAALVLHQGGIIAYPTEAVFGLGCDPHNPSALAALIQLKKRSESKGLILIASEMAQLLPYIEISSVNQAQWDTILQSWPGPYTWVFPATKQVPSLVKGQYDSVAVRVTGHPIARAICEAFGSPIVSTSANIASEAALKEASAVFAAFAQHNVNVVNAKVGEQTKPTTIQDAITGRIYRK